MIKRSPGEVIFDTINAIFMLLIIFITLYPFWYVVCASFSDNAVLTANPGILLWPKGWVTGGYRLTFKNPLLITGYKNILIILVASLPLNIVMTLFAGYFMAMRGMMFKKIFVYMMLFTMYFGGGLIPNYVLMTNLGLKNTIWGFVLPGLIGTYYVLLMRSFFASVPNELEEAGELDGLNKFGVFFRIVLPLSKPIIATMVLFYASGYWNNWFTAYLYLDDKAKWPVAYYLKTIITGASTSADPGQATAEAMQVAANIKSCSMVLMALPIICVYPFVQKYYVQGMMLGGVKE